MYERLRRDLSYIQGLLEGNSIAQNSIEHKALSRLVDVVDELIESTQQLDLRSIELEEYVETIDEDLNDLELLVYDDEDDAMEEITCPECGEDVLVDEEDLADDSVEILCPKCHTVLDLEDISGEKDYHYQDKTENEAIMPS